MNINEIDKAIAELRAGATNYANCDKLACLVICRQFLTENSDIKEKVIQEYTDILPKYREYCEIKKQYQTGDLSEQKLINAMKDVCVEIQEFIETLYTNTELLQERTIIKFFIENFSKTLKQG